MKSLAAVAFLAFTTLAFAEAPTPELVTQVLEPTGGKIQRPKNWFYHERHAGPMYMWTLSAEDTSTNQGYTTGVAIQVISDVKALTGKTPKQVILDFVSTKQKETAKGMTTCQEQDQDLFTRVCLETEEGPYHMLYSLFWGRNGMDLAVISVAGTTKELWETYAPVFEKMSDFQIIDMNRFPK